MFIKKFIISIQNLLAVTAILAIILPAHSAAAVASADIPQPKGCGPEIAVLINPANDATLTRLNPTFTFQPISGVNEYRLEVSTKLNFSDFDPEKSERGYQFILSGSTAALFTYDPASAQNFLPDTLYYWRVAPVCSSTAGPYSEAFSFKTPKSVTLPDEPVNLVPLDEITTATSGVTFTWGAVNGATSYLLRLYQYESAALTDTQYLSNGDFNAINLTRPLFQALQLPFQTTLYWRVAAANNFGIGNFSEIRSFTTPPEINTAHFSSAGGSFESEGGAVNVFVSENAVQSPSTFTIDLNPMPSTNPPFKFGNRAFSITAKRDSDGQPITQFPQDGILLTISYTDEDLAAAKALNSGYSLDLYYYSEETWNELFCLPNPSKHEVYCKLGHLTEFALGAATHVYIPIAIR